MPAKGKKLSKYKVAAVVKALTEGDCSMTEIANELRISTYSVTMIRNKQREKACASA